MNTSPPFLYIAPKASASDIAPGENKCLCHASAREEAGSAGRDGVFGTDGQSCLFGLAGSVSPRLSPPIMSRDGDNSLGPACTSFAQAVCP